MPFISTERVKEIRQELKATFPNVKFSVVTEHYTSVKIAIMESPFDWSKDYQSINRFYLDREENQEFLQQIVDIANKGNGVESEDGDYGTIPNFYLNISVGKWDKPHVKKEAKTKAAKIQPITDAEIEELFNNLVVLEVSPLPELSEGLIDLSELLDEPSAKDERLSAFELKRLRKRVRFEELARKAKNESDREYKRSDDLSQCFWGGQPILVGHHSEKRARRTQEKMHNAMRKSIELDSKAEYYKNRAEAVATNNAIFSDDPNAKEKLAEKIERLEAQQDLMRKANKLIRKNDLEGLKDLGFSDTVITKLFQPDFCGRIGFADYRLTNNSANIRRLKQRLALETSKAELETQETTINNVKIVQNIEENRTQILFLYKPSDTIRTQLKRSGFRWSSTNQAWQRHLSNDATWRAKDIVSQIESGGANV